jgi:NTE family protein
LATRPYKVALVLGGGNALGAYQAGGYQALHERGVAVDRVDGASTGAINGAIICGSAEDQRVTRLADYWGLGNTPGGPSPAPWWGPMGEDFRRSVAAMTTIAFGQPQIFAPRPPAFQHGNDASLYDTVPLGATLARLVDFERLNAGAPRFTATAVDLENGEIVTFDTAARTVAAEHIRGSSALLPAFPPVEVEGRLLGDGGLAMNLPLDPLLAEPGETPVLCLALDLLPLRQPRPRTLGEAAGRMQDLMFACQSARTIVGWQALYAARNSPASVTLLHLSYDRQEAEVAGKSFDFSPRSVRARWEAGHADVGAALDRIDAGQIETGRPGLHVWPP